MAKQFMGDLLVALRPQRSPIDGQQPSIAHGIVHKKHVLGVVG